MFLNKILISFQHNISTTLLLLLSTSLSFTSLADIHTSETQKYLVIATGDGSSEFFSFDMSNVEIGANQEVLSAGTLLSNARVGQSESTDAKGYSGTGLNTRDVFNSSRWQHSNPRTEVDTLANARPLYQGVDYSGNVALTGDNAKFKSSNADINGQVDDTNNSIVTVGIKCESSVSHCKEAIGDTAFFIDDGDANPDNDTVDNVYSGSGRGVTSLSNTAALLADLQAQRDWIVELALDETWNSGFNNRNEGHASGQIITDLDAIDTNNDGYAVINIDVGNTAFSVNNSDWILQSTQGTVAIFRMADGTQFDFASSSIMLGDGTTDSTDEIDELGAIFFQDAYVTTNQVFNLNNVILGGIGLWDFTDFNPHRNTLLSTDNGGNANSVIAPNDGSLSGNLGQRTEINMQNAQGCAQFISNKVIMSNNRWNHCAAAERQHQQVPEPSTFAVLSLALLMLISTKKPQYIG